MNPSCPKCPNYRIVDGGTLNQFPRLMEACLIWSKILEEVVEKKKVPYRFDRWA